MEFALLDTPVTFIIFNRPELTAKSFSAIAKARPKKLLIVADGPRLDRENEREKCERARAIVENVDWDCEVFRDYSDVNLGCKKRVSSGLDRAFSLFEETIVIEDDCLPGESFFRFCQELLVRYRNRDEVKLISGNNFFPIPGLQDSYLFSHHPNIWGWASWRRVWKKYDVDMKDWPTKKRTTFLSDVLPSSALTRKWMNTFERTYAGGIDTWDHQLTYAIWKENGLCISPRMNLVRNIGFGPEATHTKTLTDYANRPAEELHFPLQHPEKIVANREFEGRTRRAESLPAKIISRLKGFIGRFIPVDRI